MERSSGFANYLNARSDTGGMGGVSDTGVLAAGPDVLKPGQGLRPGQSLVSKNKRARLVFQTDGNVVLYGDGRPLWDTRSVGRGGRLFVNQATDGNLVLYGAGNAVIWSSNPAGGPVDVAIQNDANLVKYTGAGQPVWSTDTNGFKVPPSHKSIFESIGEAVGGAVTAPFSAVVHAAVGIAEGHNVLESLKSAANEAIAPARAVLAPLAPALSAAAGLASLVPGLGSVAGGALGMAAALGRGASVGDMALAAARGAIPGGPVAKVAFDCAVGIATGTPVTGIALAQIRNQIPGGDAAKAAFDAGLAVAYHATPAEAAHAARALPPAHRAGFARAVIIAHKVRRQPRAVIAEVHRKARAMTRARNLSTRAKRWVMHSISVNARVRLDTQGLNADGRTYTVERDDSAWRIAQNLTGDGNHHYTELLRANSPPKTLIRDGVILAPTVQNLAGANFKYLRTGEILKIPDVWIGKFVRAAAAVPVGAPTAPPAVTAVVTPASVPVVTPPPPDPGTTAPTAKIPPAQQPSTPPVSYSPQSSAERDDPAAIAQAKAILISWEHTDGAAGAGLPDYGGNPDDQSPLWTPRDALELRAFVVWSNAHGTALSLLGDLTQAKLDALVAWAENKSKQVADGGGTVSPSGIAPPAPAPGSDSVKAGGPVTASMISLPETDISQGDGSKKKGGGFGIGLAAIVLLGVGAVAMSAKKDRRAA